MGWLARLFGHGDNRDRNSFEQDAGRKLSPAMPPAGAGATLSGGKPDSETEDALERATDSRTQER